MLKKQKMTAKDPKEKLAFQRLTILQLAEHLGNISEACRRSGMNRTSFYEWKRRFQTHGFAGLKDLPPIHKSHPQTSNLGMHPAFRLSEAPRNFRQLAYGPKYSHQKPNGEPL